MFRATFLIVVVACTALPTASACPTCKDALAENDPVQQRMVRGYGYSIMFMMSMPFVVLGGFGTAAYLATRRARKQSVTGDVSSRDGASSQD